MRRDLERFSGSTYRLQFKDDLNADDWSISRVICGGWATASASDKVGTAAQRFL